MSRQPQTESAATPLLSLRPLGALPERRGLPGVVDALTRFTSTEAFAHGRIANADRQIADTYAEHNSDIWNRIARIAPETAVMYANGPDDEGHPDTIDALCDFLFR